MVLPPRSLARSDIPDQARLVLSTNATPVWIALVYGIVWQLGGVWVWGVMGVPGWGGVGVGGLRALPKDQAL